MRKLVRSWAFFTALLVLLLTAAATLPKLSDKLFGQTEEAVETAFSGLGLGAKEVWASWTS